jgi:hypothetical protein
MFGHGVEWSLAIPDVGTATEIGGGFDRCDGDISLSRGLDLSGSSMLTVGGCFLITTNKE